MHNLDGLLMKILTAISRGIFSQPVRLHSTYVAQMRFLFELKEDDEACRSALKQGTFYLFHSLSPFLNKMGNKYSAPQITASELEMLLAKLGNEEQKKMEDSVLIGCSDSCIAEFALDLGTLDKSTVETELKGTFTELQKAFFQLDGREAPLLSRMSPVVITLVSSGQHCLLARQKAFPRGMFSALAGFCDIGETLEETVRREVAEEVGLEVESLRYSGSQHWPFPNSSLMFACHAKVQSHVELNVNKLELEAAKWFRVEEVEEALSKDRIPARREDGTTPFWVPPKWAIAHQLIKEWVQECRS
ncbi:NAD(P)H pyrophosphatase NUDT13, mitochondrial isoform X3 [Ambystoma mexicanum]|uniref:NAD(P)H pyrophosphatase NUDT13, mitochondrial isoform X3 n=1 Tax=Ambystoma mexicanum TaxID=8296 RepID=UPI0037E81C78